MYRRESICRCVGSAFCLFECLLRLLPAIDQPVAPSVEECIEARAVLFWCALFPESGQTQREEKERDRHRHWKHRQRNDETGRTMHLACTATQRARGNSGGGGGGGGHSGDWAPHPGPHPIILQLLYEDPPPAYIKGCGDPGWVSARVGGSQLGLVSRSGTPPCSPPKPDAYSLNMHAATCK